MRYKGFDAAGMRYEKPMLGPFFYKVIDGMISSRMVADAVDIMQTAIKQGIGVNVIINNRAGGNAPIIAQEAVKKILSVLQG